MEGRVGEEARTQTARRVKWSWRDWNRYRTLSTYTVCSRIVAKRVSKFAFRRFDELLGSRAPGCARDPAPVCTWHLGGDLFCQSTTPDLTGAFACLDSVSLQILTRKLQVETKQSLQRSRPSEVLVGLKG